MRNPTLVLRPRVKVAVALFSRHGEARRPS